MTDRFALLGGVLAVFALVALLIFATSASAITPTKRDKRQARAECRAELRSSGYKSFVSNWGRPRPFRRCVRVTARELAWERRADRREAIRSCRQELREAPGEFYLEYGRHEPLRRCIRQELI